jgi:hypothetical protein
MKNVSVLILTVLLAAVVLCYRYDDYDDDYEPSYHSRRHRRRGYYSNVLGDKGVSEIEMVPLMARLVPVQQKREVQVPLLADPLSETNLAFIFAGAAYDPQGTPPAKKFEEIGGGVWTIKKVEKRVGDGKWQRLVLNERFVIWVNDVNRIIVFAFRGSSGLRDWVWTNGRSWMEKEWYVLNPFGIKAVSCGSVSQGFMEHFEKLRPAFIADLYSIKSKLQDYRVVVTGHSLGAVVAHYGAAVIGMLFKPNVQLITFGSPKAGNEAFVRCFDTYVQTRPKRYITTTTETNKATGVSTVVIDPFTLGPPKTPTFMHVTSEDIHLPCDVGSPNECHRFMGYLNGLKKANLVPITKK